MLPPAPMLATKNKAEGGKWKIADGSRFAATKSHPLSSLLHPSFLLLLALAVFLCGCGPPGPRALLKGRKFLEHGDYSKAVAEFKTATSLMSTNAQAWNYLGVAEQHAGHTADAVLAYQRALTLDRDLVEAHYNLGCLWLGQNKPEQARTEFTAYVLRRSKAPEGWTKLGIAQLRLRDITSAEKSFSTALSIEPGEAGALNGLGLAQMQRGRPKDAVRYFAAAVKAHPDFAPALLNLATVERQYLHQDRFALQNYRAYLALTPRRPDWEQVKAIVDSLEQQTGGAATPPPANHKTVSAAPRPERRAPPVVRHQPAAHPKSSPPPSHPEVAKTERPSQPEPRPSPTVETPPPPTHERTASVHRINPLNWFRSASPKSNATQVASADVNSHSEKPVEENEVNPESSPPPHRARTARPYHLVQPAPRSFPHYLYLSPSKPAPGDRRAASRAFARAREYQQEKRYQDALDSYRVAVQLDPSWFEAQYNCGVIAYRLKEFSQSLRDYEMALAIKPASEEARYNFALALRAAGYVPDAVNELKKILAADPKNVHAHLALGNLYAQQLYDFGRARAQYLEVLRLDPGNPQAAQVQFWLSANPP